MNTKSQRTRAKTGGKKRSPKYDLWLAETFRILRPPPRDMEHVSCHRPPDRDTGGGS